jgi:hypothetical protein
MRRPQKFSAIFLKVWMLLNNRFLRESGMASNWLANPKMGYQVFPVYPVPVLTIQVRISSQGKPCFHYRDGFAVRTAFSDDHPCCQKTDECRLLV